MGRNKTLPPSTMVAVLIPNTMLAMLDANKHKGRKGCSAFSRSEAVRDAIAKGLGITWKPVEQPEEKVDASTMTDAKASAELVGWANIMQARLRRNTPQHWATRMSNIAKETNLPYDLLWSIRGHVINRQNVLAILKDHFPNMTTLQIHARLTGKKH